MSLTLRELVLQPQLGIKVLVEGDLDRQIRWVHATEQADPTPYLRGGEVVLTDGLWITGPEVIDHYVSSVLKAEVAAIGYGPMPESPGVPERLIAACRQYGVCLFVMPPTLPYIAVSEVFVNRLADDRRAELNQNVLRNSRFLEATRNNGGAGALIRLLEDEIGAPVWVADAYGQTLYRGHYSPSPTDADAIVCCLAEGEQQRAHIGHDWWVEPITPSIPRGALLIAGLPEAARYAGVLVQALSFLDVELSHARATSQLRRRISAEIIELILSRSGNDDQVVNRMNSLGFAGRKLAAISLSGTDQDAILEGIEATTAMADIPSLTEAQGDQVITLAGLQGEHPDFAKLAEQLQNNVRAASAIGSCTPMSATRPLRDSIIDSVYSCRVAANRINDAGRSDVKYHKIPSHRILIETQDPEVLRRFVASTLYQIEAYDRRTGSSLIKTLEEFFRSGERWQETADHLHVHVNTLRNRMRRIEQLTRTDLTDFETRVSVYLALQSRKYI